MKQKDPDIVYALRRRIEGRSVFNRLLVEKERSGAPLKRSNRFAGSSLPIVRI